ncbi:PPC domain-containing protein [Actinokineospora cianjurensis]|uniref:Pre-peptidase n=1 Tax=Actinokineospora cianjurensis TaxID=585224 RepID=A0A421B2E4_9PSEU|nr:PPC domain-containing protein [Actinokineospora cianjurensis]RLK58561.1 hypothetical protein CLV68_3029 [Actinokineospora cianjurensis]
MKKLLAVGAALITLCSGSMVVRAAQSAPVPSGSGGRLVSGVPTTGQVEWNTRERWTVEVPMNTANLAVTVDGAGAHLDLIGRAGAAPTVFTHDLKADTADGTADVSVPLPRAGLWYLEVSGRFLFEPHTYTITATAGGTPPTTTAPSTTTPTTTAPTSTTRPTSTTSSPPTTTPPGTPVVVDRNCADGKFVLTVEDFREPDRLPSIQDLVNGYNSADYMGFINGVLSRRYPTGKRVIDIAGGKQAVDRWLWRKDTAAQVLGQLSMVVHEVGHGIDKSTPENRYFVARGSNGADVTFTAPGMHGKGTTSSSPMFSMARSLLLADAENKKRPPAVKGTITTSREYGSGSHGSDPTYAETYLNGDPTNTTFDSGDQGFNMLVEEWNQYINSMAVTYSLQTGGGSRTSDRHALLTYLWWVERYLAKIRVEHPEQHDYLVTSPAWRETVLALWGRSWRYLNTDTGGMEPDSGQVTELVRQPHLLTEIHRLRTANGCTNPVELFP